MSERSNEALLGISSMSDEHLMQRNLETFRHGERGYEMQPEMILRPPLLNFFYSEIYVSFSIIMEIKEGAI